MVNRAMWVVAVAASMMAGCGIKEDVEAVKKLDAALESQVGGEPSVNYSVGSEGKVIKVKFFGKLKDPDTAAATTKKLVDTHVKNVDKLEIWKCEKEAGGVESCIGM